MKTPEFNRTGMNADHEHDVEQLMHSKARLEEDIKTLTIQRSEARESMKGMSRYLNGTCILFKRLMELQDNTPFTPEMKEFVGSLFVDLNKGLVMGDALIKLWDAEHQIDAEKN